MAFSIVSRVTSFVDWLLRVVANAAYKFWWDDCFSRASSLAYSTLFALVPMSAIAFAMYRGFSLDDAQLERILQNILPASENELIINIEQQVIEYLREFGESVRALGVVAVGVLAFAGIALLNTIESAMNVIWRVTSNLSILSKVISFWAVITLGPILIALSFYWYSRFGTLTEGGQLFHSHIFPALNVVVPIAFIWFALTLLYYKLPAAVVSIHDAAFGALIAAVAFEFSKIGFAEYVSVSITYKSFYGVLVAIPVFLLWLYVMWVVVLFGAEISYQAGSIKVLSGLRKYASDLGEIGAVLGLRILYHIGGRFVDGKTPPTESEIAIDTGSDPMLVRSCLAILTDANLITFADPEQHTRSLVRAPDKITVRDIVRAFQSERYRKTIADNGDRDDPAIEFLRIVRLGVDSSGQDRPIAEWTLSEFLQAPSQ